MSLSFARRLLLAAICAVSVGTVYAAQPMLTPIGADLGIPGSQLGWIVTVSQAGYLLGLFLAVPLGDMVDRRRLITAHLALTALGACVASVAPVPSVLLVGVAIAGFFAVVVQTTVAFAASMSEPQERGRNLGFVTSGVVIGILGARVVAGAVADLWGWRSVYAVFAVVLFAMSVLVVLALPADPRDDRAKYRDVLRASGLLFRQRPFLSRGLIAFFLFASFGTLWSGIALPLGSSPWHLNTAQIGLFGLVGLAGAIGAGRAGVWADQRWATCAAGGCLLLLALSWSAIGQATWSLWLLVVGIIVLDFAVQVVHVSNQHVLTTAHPDRTSSAIGNYMVFYSAGSALGAETTAWIYSVSGWTASSLLGAAYAAFAFTVWVATRRVAVRNVADAAVPERSA